MFDKSTDKGSLERRINCHSKYALKEINNWIFDIVKPKKEEIILDLGCGTGKQLIPLAEFAGDNGKVVGVDISQEALDRVEEVAKERGLNNIILLKVGLDDCLNLIPDYKYTLIHSSYAIYYSQNQVSLINSLHSYLSEKGRIFICGQDSGNNSELIDLYNSMFTDEKRLENMVSFINDKEIKDAFKSYSDYKLYRFQNPIVYPTPESVFDYWKNYALYKEEYKEQFIALLKEFYKKNDNLTVNKKVLGILSYA